MGDERSSRGSADAPRPRTLFVLRGGQDGPQASGRSTAQDGLAELLRDRERRLLEIGDLLARAGLDLAARDRELKELRGRYAAAQETIQRQHAAYQRLAARLAAPGWRRAWRWLWGWR